MKKTRLFPVFALTLGLIMSGCTGNGGGGSQVVETGNDGSLAHPYTAKEAAILCDKAGTNKVVGAQKFYVEGIFDANTTATTASLWSGGLDNSMFNISGAKLASTIKVNDVNGKLNGKKVLAYGFIGNVNGVGKMAKFANGGAEDPVIVKVDDKADYTDPDYVEPVHNDGTLEKPFTVQEAYDKMAAAGDGVVVDRKEYYVKGTFGNDTKVDVQYNEWSGTLGGKISVSGRLTEKMNVTPTDGALNGKEIVIKGYLELYQGVYKISYLPASASPTGNKYNPTIVQIEGKDDYDDGYVKADPLDEPIEKLFVNAPAKVSVPSTGIDAWEGIAILEDDYYACVELTPCINAYTTETTGTIGTNSYEDKYKAVMDSASGWYRLDSDSDEYYNYDNFGYIYGDSASLEESNVVIQFYSVEEEDGTLSFWYWIINLGYEYDGHFTDYDGNELPLWHEILTDPEYGYTRGQFPLADIKEKLGLDFDDIYSFYVNDTCSQFFPATTETDEETGETSTSPRCYEVCYNPIYLNYILEDMEDAGLDVQMDLYGGATVFDPAHRYEIYVSAYYEDEEAITPYVITFDYYNIADIYTTQLTTNTEWTTEEKEAIASVIGENEIPFMQFGNAGEWEAYPESNIAYFSDSYYLDLTADYAALLEAAGYTYVPYDDATFSGDYYSLVVNGSEIQIALYWSSVGNFIYIYYIPAPTEIVLNKTEVNVKPGKTVQLTAEFGPAGCNTEGLEITWSSDSSFITVDENGLVTVASDAVVNSTGHVTATCGELSASCLVTVADSSVADAGWYKVTDASDLTAGDKIILACEVKGTICNNVLNTSNHTLGYETGATFADGMITSTVSTDYGFVLGGEAGAWTLSVDGKYITTGTGKTSIAFSDTASTTWTISINEAGSATISSSTASSTRFMYNAGAPRFANYSSNVSDSMILPNIYVYVD